MSPFSLTIRESYLFKKWLQKYSSLHYFYPYVSYFFVRFSYVIKMILDVGSMLNDFDRGWKMLFYKKDREPKRFKGAISKEKVFLLGGRKHLTI